MSRVIAVPVQARRALVFAATSEAWEAWSDSPPGAHAVLVAQTGGGTEVPLRAPVPSGSGALLPRARS